MSFGIVVMPVKNERMILMFSIRPCGHCCLRIPLDRITSHYCGYVPITNISKLARSLNFNPNFHKIWWVLSNSIALKSRKMALQHRFAELKKSPWRCALLMVCVCHRPSSHGGAVWEDQCHLLTLGQQWFNDSMSGFKSCGASKIVKSCIALVLIRSIYQWDFPWPSSEGHPGQVPSSEPLMTLGWGSRRKLSHRLGPRPLLSDRKFRIARSMLVSIESNISVAWNVNRFCLNHLVILDTYYIHRWGHNLIFFLGDINGIHQKHTTKWVSTTLIQGRCRNCSCCCCTWCISYQKTGQWEFQDPIDGGIVSFLRPYFLGIFPYIGLILI